MRRALHAPAMSTSAARLNCGMRVSNLVLTTTQGLTLVHFSAQPKPF